MLLTVFAAYYLYRQVQTADLRLSWLMDLKVEKARKALVTRKKFESSQSVYHKEGN